MIIACVIAYNEERMLPGCLESVRDQVDRMVVVDGAYARFPHPVGHPESTDRTREIAWCFGVEIIPLPAGRAWEDQVEKRNAYLVGEAGDWYLMVDADERLVGTLPEREPGRHYAFQVATRDGRMAWVPRLWQHPASGRIYYEGAHNALWLDGGLMRLEDAIQVPPVRCRLEHLSHLREVRRQRDKAQFLPGRQERERVYRMLYGI